MARQGKANKKGEETKMSKRPDRQPATHPNTKLPRFGAINSPNFMRKVRSLKWNTGQTFSAGYHKKEEKGETTT